jgi:hypothetical protein
MSTKLIAVLGVLAAAFAVAITYAPAEDKKPAPPVGAAPAADPHAAQFTECAKECGECARVCDSCAAHCAKLMAAGNKEHLSTQATCADCASLCTSAARCVARMGPFSDLACTACAEACKRCGDACDKHAAHDAVMKQCTDECRKCEKSCRDMLTHLKK